MTRPRIPLALQQVGAALVALALLLLPFVGSGYHLKLLTLVLMSITLAQAWNLLGGFTGYMSFGHIAFFGLGGYAAVLLMLHLAWPFLPAALGGGLLAAAFAALVGPPLLRVRGHYFAVASFAVGEAMRELANNLNAITGGGMGLQAPLFEGGVEEQNRFFYLAMLALALLATATVWLVARSRFGYGLRAIREDEDVASALGVNVHRHKLGALALSALLAGLAGAVYAYWITFLEPADLFNLSYSVHMVVMAVLGGAGTVLGPVLGAVVVLLFNEVFWSSFLELHNAFLGLVLVAVVLFLPRGLLGLFAPGQAARAPFGIRVPGARGLASAPPGSFSRGVPERPAPVGADNRPLAEP